MGRIRILGILFYVVLVFGCISTTINTDSKIVSYEDIFSKTKLVNYSGRMNGDYLETAYIEGPSISIDKNKEYNKWNLFFFQDGIGNRKYRINYHYLGIRTAYAYNIGTEEHLNDDILLYTKIGDKALEWSALDIEEVMLKNGGKKGLRIKVVGRESGVVMTSTEMAKYDKNEFLIIISPDYIKGFLDKIEKIGPDKVKSMTH